MKEVVMNEVYALRAAGRGSHRASGSTPITQEELAAAVGVSRQTIIAIEKGNYTPSVLLALKIAHFFKKPIEEIFAITYEK